MEVMMQQEGESPLPDAVPLDSIAPTPPSLVVRIQTDQPISTGHATTSLDSANIDRLRTVAQFSRAVRDLGIASGPSEKLRAASLVRDLVLKRPDSSENCGT